jgi:hypothetical protein
MLFFPGFLVVSWKPKYSGVVGYNRNYNQVPAKFNNRVSACR